MEYFDEVVSKVKDVIDVASKKTNEVVTTQKQKFDISSLENKRAKDFAALGEIIYNKIKDTEIEETNIKELVTAINEKNAKIDQLRTEINNTKNKRICPACGAAIEQTSNYCNACGTKIVFGEE